MSACSVFGKTLTAGWRATRYGQHYLPPTGPVLVGGRALLDAHAAGERVVVLFVDTFNGAFERENVDAAIAVLGAAGYKVHIPRWTPQGDRDERNLCCGRTFPPSAWWKPPSSRRTICSALLEFAEAGIDIVGEPSCLFTLRDEILAMRLGEEADVVGHAMLDRNFPRTRGKRANSTNCAPSSKPASSPIPCTATATRKRLVK